MDERELVALLAGKIDSALNDDDGELSATRQKNLDYYLGEPFGNEREGYSQYRSREVLETVEWVLPALLRVFAAGDRAVQFDPIGPEDEDQAEQETEAVQFALARGNEYFATVYTWIKSALLEPVAYVKAWMDREVKVTGEQYRGLTEAELTQLMADPEVEVTAQSVSPAGIDVNIKRTCVYPKLRIEPIPGEETLIDASHNKLALDDCEFVCHRTKKTYSWLVSAGFDRDLLDEVSAESGRDWAGEKVNRLFTEDESWANWDDGHGDESLRTYWVHEISALVDVDGDGVAERRRIVLIGDKIFENEEHDYVPIVALCAIPMPHRHPGLAEADLVKDLQLLKSTLIRQLLDNVYRVNRPRSRVGINALTDDGKTLQSLLDPMAEFIPCEDPSAIIDEQRTSFVSELLPVIQFVTESQQTRTGIAPNLSLDPAVLQKTTMGAFQGALEQASQRVELLARIMAETGFKWLAMKVHRLLKEHSQRPQMMKVRGQWIEVNPADWRERENVSVNVGLGFNDRSKELMATQSLLAAQLQLIQFGIVNPQNLLQSASDLVTASGKKSPERYFSEPPPPAPPQPDPNLLVAQAQAQAMQTDAQSKVMRAQVEGQKAQLDMQKAQFEAQLTAREQDLKLRESELKLQIAQLEAQIKLAESQAAVQNTIADSGLKDAQRIKTLAEAKEKQLDADALESGVIDLLEGAHVPSQIRTG